MSLWALAHFFTFTVNLLLAGYILVKNRESALNRVCAATVFLFCVWSLGTTFMRDPRISAANAHLLNSVASLGWISFGSAFLLFALYFTGKMRKRPALISSLVLALPAPFVAAQWAGAFMKLYRLETYGWVGVWESSLLTTSFYLYYSCSIMAGLALIWRFRSRSRDTLVRKQGIILFISVLATLLLGSLSSILLRRLGIYSVPPLGDLFTIIFAFGLFYATARYRLFELNPATAADKILETMNDALILVDTSGTIIACNPALTAILGYDHDELLGSKFTRIFPGEEYSLRYIKELLRRGSLSNVRGPLLTRDGRKIAALISAGVMKNDNGRPQGFVMVAHDYTELQEAERKLQHLLDTTKSILEWLPFGVVTVGRDRIIRSANRHAITLLKVGSPEDIVGAPCHRYLCPGNTCTCPVLDAEKKIENVEKTVQCVTGEQIPILKSVMEIELEGEEVLLETFIDISELKRIQDELTFARDAAEAANRAKSAFLANMSHEIRTPLNAIMGFTQLLLAGENDPATREKLSIISQSGENLLATINDILDFSRIEAGKVTLDETEFSLDDLCDTISQVFTLRAREKNLLLTITAGEGMPPLVRGDRHRTRQIVSNLVDNALKFTGEGGVTLEYVFDSGMVTFRVSDTGIGIPDDKRDTVFSAFDQVDPSSTRQHGGTGLGLAIVKSLTEQMGGSIALQSEVGRGSTFTVTLPLREVSGAAPGTTITAGPGDIAKSDAPTTAFKVLVAEDNDLNRRLMGRLLETLGMEFDTAENGREALDKLLSARDAGRPFDLLFLDIQMPVMDGRECLAEIRRDGALSGLHVIALTAHALAGDAENFLKLGFNDYISKPVDIHEFFKKVKSLAGN
jgi:PAS domain S-box-containing protein